MRCLMPIVLVGIVACMQPPEPDIIVNAPIIMEGSGSADPVEMVHLQSLWEQMRASDAKQRARDRFTQNKFGMFIHWGPYSQAGGVWNGEKMEDGGTGPSVAEWIMRRKEISRADYRSLASQFDPVDFDAQAWVALAKDAGMKYIVITAKHHDGFAMFDSEVSDFDILDASPFGRDVIRELEQASKEAGIDFGVYYSHSVDWYDGGDSGYQDYAPENARNIQVNNWDPSPTSYDTYIATKSLPQVAELVQNYDLSQVWFDYAGSIPAGFSFDFYKLIYDENPEILTNRRLGNGFGDIGNPGDNVIPNKTRLDLWEGIATTNHSWGYKSYDTDWKTMEETLYWLVANVSRGGNFLLNVGPDGQGNIPAESAVNLRKVGQWLSINGEAIYGSKPWLRSHEGPTKIDIAGGSAGEKYTFDFDETDFWFTRKGNRIYVISFKAPADGIAKIRSLRTAKISSIRLLGAPNPLDWQAGENSLNVTLPNNMPSPMGYVLEVQTTP